MQPSISQENSIILSSALNVGGIHNSVRCQVSTATVVGDAVRCSLAETDQHFRHSYSNRQTM
jgi:L-arabinose isomerase